MFLGDRACTPNVSFRLRRQPYSLSPGGDVLHHLRARQSISVKLPALFSALLVIAIATFSFVAHRQIQHVLLGTAAGRVASASHVLAGMLEDSERHLRAESEKVASDSAVRRFAANPTAASRSAAQKSVASLAGNGQQTIGIELRDKQLRRTLWVDAKSADSAAFLRSGPQRLISRGTSVGLLQSDKDNIFYQVVAPIHSPASPGDTSGYVVVYKRISSANGAQIIDRLIGP